MGFFQVKKIKESKKGICLWWAMSVSWDFEDAASHNIWLPLVGLWFMLYGTITKKVVVFFMWWIYNSRAHAKILPFFLGHEKVVKGKSLWHRERFSESLQKNPPTVLMHNYSWVGQDTEVGWRLVLDGDNLQRKIRRSRWIPLGLL